MEGENEGKTEKHKDTGRMEEGGEEEKTFGRRQVGLD